MRPELKYHELNQKDNKDMIRHDIKVETEHYFSSVSHIEELTPKQTSSWLVMINNDILLMSDTSARP